jgi:RND family efflux transporter MFP subunit
MSDELSSDLASLRINRNEPPARNRSALRAVSIGVGVLAVGALGAVFGAPKVEGILFKTEVMKGEITLISPAQASVSLTSTGYVIPTVSVRVGISFNARVAKVLVKEGDAVKAGATLLEFDAAGQEAAVSAAQARVGVARARATAERARQEELKRQIQRERTLVERNVTARATLEDLEARLSGLEETARAADAEVQATSAEVESLRATLRDRRIVAPVNGTVLTRPPTIGEVVGPEQPILELVDFTSLVVEVDVPEARLYMIEIGKPCEIVLDAYPSKRYRGSTLELGKRVNRAKATVPVRVKFSDSAENVLPEMSARVSFLSEALSEEAMKQPPKRVVPDSAVVDRLGGKAVFVIDGDQVKLVPVQVGAPAPGGFELLDGPQAGTRLVLGPPPNLTDRQKVKEKAN